MPIQSANFSHGKTLRGHIDTAILLIPSQKKIGVQASALDKDCGGMISHHIKTHSVFQGEIGQSLVVSLTSKAPYLRVILLGVGDMADDKAAGYETVGGKLVELLTAHGSEQAAIMNADDLQKPSVVTGIIYGMRLGAYRFDGYKTKKKDPKKPDIALKGLQLITQDKHFAQASHDVEAISGAVATVRDLVNEPPNKLYPASFAERAKRLLTPLGVKVTVMDEKALAKAGMGCIIAVGQASEFPPRLVIMEWAGTAKKSSGTKGKKVKPLAFVGKGITFDTGGLNLKPYEGMLDMKMDMAGAATVVGLMQLLATRKCTRPVVGVIALAENAVSDEATRPSDIVTSYSGKTVEILNTDAEGRLVLADALTYVQQKFDPQIVVNLATLTGAIMISLGLEYCGAFVNNDALWTKLEKSGLATSEKIWRMPLDKSFRREMDSVFADIRNVGNGRFGGSCTAAAFLSEFIDEGRPWAHLDIAGVAMSKTTPTCPVPFASGYGIKLLNNFVEDYVG